MKKEIKKLQRFREQIKNWMSGSDVKEKGPLIEHRKLIEHEMERFKEVEKMMKTKAFSNEALASTTDIVDPKKKEKMETADFIQNNIEELQRQMESMEAEIDQINSTLKKKKSDSAKQSQILSLQEKLSRHKWHISMLESILRHLENDNLDVEQINDIKEDIEYYVESNEDPNFIEDDTFYEFLGLDDMEDSFAVIPGDDSELQDISGRENSVSGDKEKVNESLEKVRKDRLEKEKEKEKIEKEKERERNKKIKEKEEEKVPESYTATLQSQLSQPNQTSPHVKTTSLASTLSASLNASNLSNNLLNGGLKPATPVSTPKLKYATAALSGIKKTATIAKTPTTVSYASLASAVANANVSTGSPGKISQVQAISLATNHVTESNKALSSSSSSFLSNTTGSNENTTSVPLSSGLNNTININSNNFNTNPINNISEDIENLAAINASRILNNNTSNNPQVNNIQEALSLLNMKNDNLPKGFDTYLKSLETAKERMFEFKKREELHVPSKKSQPPAIVCDIKLPPLEEISSHLESSLLNCPDSFDADKPRSYIPINPFITQPSFPTDPLPEMIGCTKLLEKVTIDTLFYGFYYNNLRTPSKFTNFHNLEANPDDDYLQYIMANELHKRGWNYQAHTHTWYEPDDVEKDDNGDNKWRSFDFKDTWLERRNAGFQYDANDVETGYL